MKSTLTTILVSLSLIVSLSSSGCGSKTTATTSSADGSGSEVAISTVAGAANSTEGSLAFLKGEKSSFFADFLNYLSTSAWAAACSPMPSCTGNEITWPLTGCTVNAVTFTGNMIFTWQTGTCASPPKNSAANSVFTRTTDSAGIVRSQGASQITTTTADSSGFSAAKTGGFSITCASTASGCLDGRTISILGVHNVGTTSDLQWDHTVSTDTPVVVTGVGATRTISCYVSASAT